MTMESHRVDTEHVHADVVQVYVIEYSDRPCDVVYDVEIARDLYALPNAEAMTARVVVRHDQGYRSWCGLRTLASEVAASLRTRNLPLYMVYPDCVGKRR